MYRKILFTAAIFIGLFQDASAQGHLSGNLMTNVYFFNRDTSINASNNPLYDNFLSGGESWLGLRYNYKGFSANIRMDAFQNSNLLNPTAANSGFGIGAWTLNQEVGDLTITGGYIYDQIGSGILFRTYEDRGLLIDNALVGLRLKYKINKNISVKAMGGQSKFLFTRYAPIIKAFNIEGDYSLGRKGHTLAGIGVLNRTLDAESMNGVQKSINNQPLDTRFTPRYNMYGITAYNNLTLGNFNWYAEGTYKTHEAILNQDILIDEPGTVFYSTLSYAQKGIAINLSGKRTENFEMRTSPNEVLLRGMMNWQPVIARLRPQRLLARYSPATLNLSEEAFAAEALLNPNDDFDITLNYANINTLEKVKLYRELYGQVEYRGIKKAILSVGAQYLEYNEEIYQVHLGAPLIFAITPFVDFTYRLPKQSSIRTEWEYMHTDQNFGSWLFGLVEFNFKQKWSLAISDMYITKLNKHNPVGLTEPKHFYNFFVAYNKGPHRLSAAYVKQVEGINCTGGVCRYEPAFSGIKFNFTSSF